MPPSGNNFATIKVRQRFRRWLKEEAARRELPMYRLLENLAADGIGERPWLPKTVTADKPRWKTTSKTGH